MNIDDFAKELKKAEDRFESSKKYHEDLLKELEKLKTKPAASSKIRLIKNGYTKW